MKKQLILLFIVCIVFAILSAAIPFLALRVNHYINIDIEGTTYNIMQLKNNDVFVEFDDNVVCFQAPCPPVRTKRKLAFSRRNIKTVNRFLNSLFKDTKKTKISLTVNDLSEEDMPIIKSIIYNNQEFLNQNISLKGQYTIITDSKTRTLLNDGGSNTNIYYVIDLGKKTVAKYEESYHANLGGTPSTTKMLEYTKNINNLLLNDTQNLLNNLLDKDNKKDDNNYHPYIIKSENREIEIYDSQDIYELKVLINKFEGSK